MILHKTVTELARSLQNLHHPPFTTSRRLVMEKKAQCSEEFFDLPDGVKGSRNFAQVQNSLLPAVQARFDYLTTPAAPLPFPPTAIGPLRRTANLPQSQRLRS